MKTNLLSILLLFFFVNIFSQTISLNNTDINPEGKLFFGAEIGSNSIGKSITKESKTYFQVGLLAEYYFARHWSISTKIKYYKTGVSFYNKATGGWFGHDKNSGNFNGEVISIPLNIKWEFRIRRNLNAYLLVGYNYIKETKSEYYNYSEKYNTNKYPNSYFGGNIEYGFNYYLDSKSAVFVGFEHHSGDEKGKTTGSIVSNSRPILTSNYLINFGYKYNFNFK